MLMETIPELANLSPEEKLLLAAELLHEALCDSDTDTPDPQLVGALRERLAYYNQHKDEVVSWEVLRARLRNQLSCTVGEKPSAAAMFKTCTLQKET